MRNTTIALLFCLCACGGDDRLVLEEDCQLVEPVDPTTDCYPLTGPPTSFPARISITLSAQELGDRPGEERAVPIESAEALLAPGSDPVCTATTPTCALGGVCSVDVVIDGVGLCGLSFSAQTASGPTTLCEVYGWAPTLDSEELFARFRALCEEG